MLALIREKIKKKDILFLMTVIGPTILSIIYYALIASDIYTSTSKFVVRSPDKPSTSGLGIILKTAGFSNANDETFAVQAYVGSRDALKSLNKNDDFRKAFEKSDISFLNRFNPTGLYGSFEDLYAYYTGKVGVDYDTTSSISTLTVNAYSPEDAHRFNERLLGLAEGTVNRLNVRGRDDLIRFASADVDEAKRQAQNAALALAKFRNASGIVDPEKQAEIQMQMISKLQDELLATNTRIVELRNFAPRNSQIEALRVRAETLREAIQEETGKVAGSAKSLSAHAVEYQRLLLESQVSDKLLAGALSSLEEARNEARRKQAYVERIAEPNLPDAALQPNRIKGIITTLLLGLVAWAILSMLIAGVREHHD